MVIRRLPGWGLAGLVVTALAACQTPEPKPVLGQPIPEISLETYHHIMDIIFAPKDKPQGAIAFSLNVRIAPAFRPESQVNLTLLQDRTTRAEYVVAEKNVYYGINELLRTTGESRAEALAQKTPVKRHALNSPPALLMKWQQELAERLSPNFLVLQPDLQKMLLRQPATVVVDGDSYEVWYRQGLTDLHINFPQAATPTPLETWAKAVHSGAAKMALRSNQ
jgi:hypothetical protein